MEDEQLSFLSHSVLEDSDQSQAPGDTYHVQDLAEPGPFIVRADARSADLRASTAFSSFVSEAVRPTPLPTPPVLQDYSRQYCPYCDKLSPTQIAKKEVGMWESISNLFSSIKCCTEGRLDETAIFLCGKCGNTISKLSMK